MKSKIIWTLCFVVVVYFFAGIYFGSAALNSFFDKDIKTTMKGIVVNGEFKKWDRLCYLKSDNVIDCKGRFDNVIEKKEKEYRRILKKIDSSIFLYDIDGVITNKYLSIDVKEEIACVCFAPTGFDPIWFVRWGGIEKQEKEEEVVNVQK